MNKKSRIGTLKTLVHMNPKLGNQKHKTTIQMNPKVGNSENVIPSFMHPWKSVPS